jgi:hypothetical protein
MAYSSIAYAMRNTDFHKRKNVYFKQCLSKYFLIGPAMIQAINRRPVVVEVWVCARVSICGTFGKQSGTGTDFSQISSVSPVNIIPPWLSMPIYITLGKNNRLVGGGSSET